MGIPDFGRGSNAVLVAGGQSATAVVLLTITRGDFTNFNHRVPHRCTITLTVTSIVPGNTEPTASNNTTTVELNVIDKNQPENTVLRAVGPTDPDPDSTNNATQLVIDVNARQTQSRWLGGASAHEQGL